MLLWLLRVLQQGLLLLLLLVLQNPKQEFCCIDVKECVTNVAMLHDPNDLNITDSTTSAAKKTAGHAQHGQTQQQQQVICMGCLK